MQAIRTAFAAAGIELFLSRITTSACGRVFARGERPWAVGAHKSYRIHGAYRSHGRATKSRARIPIKRAKNKPEFLARRATQNQSVQSRPTLAASRFAADFFVRAIARTKKPAAPLRALLEGKYARAPLRGRTRRDHFRKIARAIENFPGNFA